MSCDSCSPTRSSSWHSSTCASARACTTPISSRSGRGNDDAITHLPALARLVALAGDETPCTSSRVIGVEQSNSSVVIDESVVLKLYRRLEAGPSPEVELLRALEEAGFDSAPRLLGAIEHDREPLEATLAVVTEHVPSAGGGWELTLASLEADDLDWLPAGRAGSERSPVRCTRHSPPRPIRTWRRRRRARRRSACWRRRSTRRSRLAADLP